MGNNKKLEKMQAAVNKDELYNKGLRKVQKFIDSLGEGVHGDFYISVTKYGGSPRGLRGYLYIDLDTGDHYFAKDGPRWYRSLIDFSYPGDDTKFNYREKEGWRQYYEMIDRKLFLKSHQDMSYYEAYDPDFVTVVNCFFTFHEMFESEIAKKIEELKAKEKYCIKKVREVAEEVA